MRTLYMCMCICHIVFYIFHCVIESIMCHYVTVDAILLFEYFKRVEIKLFSYSYCNEDKLLTEYCYYMQ